MPLKLWLQKSSNPVIFNGHLKKEISLHFPWTSYSIDFITPFYLKLLYFVFCDNKSRISIPQTLLQACSLNFDSPQDCIFNSHHTLHSLPAQTHTLLWLQFSVIHRSLLPVLAPLLNFISLHLKALSTQNSTYPQMKLTSYPPIWNYFWILY